MGIVKHYQANSSLSGNDRSVKQNSNQSNRPMMPMMNTHYYGGFVEHWFKPTMGVEAGMIWMRDIFSGKIRPQPKLELLFRPGR